MAQTASIILRAEDRARLAAVLADRNQPAEACLPGSDHSFVGGQTVRCGCRPPSRSQPPGGMALAAALRRGGSGRLAAGHDAQARQGPLSLEIIAKVLLPCSEPPGEATHWTGRMVAKAVGVSLSAVQRLWAANGGTNAQGGSSIAIGPARKRRWRGPCRSELFFACRERSPQDRRQFVPDYLRRSGGLASLSTTREIPSFGL
jgi:hypothetical protein